MFQPVHPRKFIDEFVDPSIKLWQNNQFVTHLAVHAMTQLDVLAEVVAVYTLLGSRPTLPRNDLRAFRAALAGREPVLAIIRDAHDCHKHGALDRKDALARQGQRPEEIVHRGEFLDASFFDSEPIKYSFLAFCTDDGKEHQVYPLLKDARTAWDREFARLSL